MPKSLAEYIGEISPDLREKFFTDLVYDEELNEAFERFSAEILGILDTKLFDTIVTTRASGLKSIMLRAFIEGYMTKAYEQRKNLENYGNH